MPIKTSASPSGSSPFCDIMLSCTQFPCGYGSKLGSSNVARKSWLYERIITADVLFPVISL